MSDQRSTCQAALYFEEIQDSGAQWLQLSSHFLEYKAQVPPINIEKYLEKMVSMVAEGVPLPWEHKVGPAGCLPGTGAGTF